LRAAQLADSLPCPPLAQPEASLAARQRRGSEEEEEEAGPRPRKARRALSPALP